MAREGRLENCQAIHRTLAEGIMDAFSMVTWLSVTVMIINQTPVRADSVWSMLTLDNESILMVAGSLYQQIFSARLRQQNASVVVGELSCDR